MPKSRDDEDGRTARIEAALNYLHLNAKDMLELAKQARRRARQATGNRKTGKPKSTRVRRPGKKRQA